MEPPSPTLTAALRDLRLATPRELRRAAGRCRSIARDLPAFDCVWIDALVRVGCLTPFQGSLLQDGDPDRLRIGDFVLLDRLGGGDSATFTARPSDGSPVSVLTKFLVASDRRVPARARLEALCGSGAEFASPNVVVPHAVFDNGDRLVVVSRFVEGRDARATLVHSGRLPGEGVAEIARQLLAGLGAAHRVGLPHGDIRIANLRLLPRGEAVLVSHGVRSAVSPVLPIDDVCAPERYDGVAPERIGTAAAATAEADVYAMGCLLWHLLAGRPPFATGDPLGKLTAHRSRPVPDVREFAPDAPAELTRLVTEMTDRDPARRPSDLGEAHRTLSRSRRTGRRVLAGAAGGTPGTKFPWSVAAAALFALAGASYALVDQGGAAKLLNTTLGGAAEEPAERSPAGRAERETYAALPAPDATGVLAFGHAGPFEAAEVAFQGPLALRGRPERPATIVVTDRPLHLWADGVTLEHIRIVHRPSAALASRPPALLLVEAQNLAVRSCRVESPVLAVDERYAAPSGLAWRLVDRADPTAGRVEVRDSVFHGVREAVFAADIVRRADVENVLAVGGRTLLSFGAGDRSPSIRLAHVTIRDAGSVLAFRGDGAANATVSAADSILDLGPTGKLVDASAGSSVRWSGAGVFSAHSVLLFGGPVTRTADTSGGQPGGRVDGVTTATVAFAGRPGGSDAASVARVSGVPRLAGQTPGIDLSRLPREAVWLDGAR